MENVEYKILFHLINIINIFPSFQNKIKINIYQNKKLILINKYDHQIMEKEHHNHKNFINIHLYPDYAHPIITIIDRSNWGQISILALNHICNMENNI